MSTSWSKLVRVRFHGVPDSLEALIPARAQLAAARLELPKLEFDGEAYCSEAGCGLWWVHARLPPSTPPGLYEGQLYVDADGDQELELMSVEIEVAPQYEATMSPGQVIVQLEPGARTQHQFVLLNRGNTDLTVPRDSAFGLMREGSIEDALSAAYRTEKARGHERVDMAAELLAERHVLVSARIEDGPITVSPQAHARFVVALRWPDALEAGHVYAGTWSVAHQTLSVRAHVHAPVSKPAAK